jgi:cytoskeleton protein RodZ
MKSVGEKLRRERMQRGVGLDTLAEMTRINARYLEAIEDGKPEDLPGGFFYRSFVRQYATALNLDMEEIEADLERAKDAEAPILSGGLGANSFPTKQPDPIVMESNRGTASGKMWAYVAMLAAVLVGCSVIYAWWNQVETSVAARTPEPSAVVAEPPPVATAPAEPASSGAGQSSADAGQAQTPIGVPVSSVPDPAVVQPPSTPAPSAEVSADDRIVMNLSASEDTWVQVTADGKVIFVGILTANQTRTLGGKESARIRTGNAGALDVKWNGKSLGPIGPRGQIRTVVLTPESYRVIGPTSPAEVQEQPTGL